MSGTRSRGAAVHARPRGMSRSAAFWLIGLTQCLMLFASSAPSPLYVVYQARWKFSSIALTEVFALYAIALLVALLVVGGLSDYVGRKPVLVTALVLEAVSMVLFIGADGVGWLLAARAVQGVATGAATGATSAAILDLHPPDKPRLGPLVNTTAPNVGLALGALGAGLLVQYAPHPTVLVYALLLIAFVVLACCVPAIPETSPRGPGALASLAPRMGVPRRIRPLFLVVAPCLFAVWALGGLYMSLGSSIAAGILHLSNHVVGGLVVFALTGTGAVGSLLRRNRQPRRTMTGGFVAFLVGVGLTLGALETTSTALFFVGTVVAGYGFGTGFLGAFQTIGPLAAPAERAQLVSSMYVVCYLGFSLPAVAAGVAVREAGLRPTATVYGVAVMVLAAAATLGLLAQSRRDARRTSPVPGDPAPQGAGSPP
ncbi:MFS transporter [Streptomyces netropsis]|uniref:Putative MFS family arabinose efflux permease n=1 Tax=Streptomyces netropsis TaxID=55404 RepID=A0A7W7PCR7_STRNE|nr:MFS transporter [Streptomyces netropsis]MBB4884328.1 putative MFS family arabinose efflux permease [Streptomyces netropsis]GGR04478.1 MFS transporter [Streptomyces netropsis]